MSDPGPRETADRVEPYVDRRRMAEILGVSVATVDRLVAAGLPSERWGRRTRRFQPTCVVVWLKEHQQR
jgi:phage terminase Nu1 subunit (DNA packaging protein)